MALSGSAADNAELDARNKVSHFRWSLATLGGMSASNLPEPYARIDRLIEGGDTAEAERALNEHGGDADIVEMLRAKIALAKGTQPALSVMNRLVHLMRRNENLPGLQDLYREASRLAYESRQSSLAHSHPPPPMVPKRDDTK